MNKSIENIVLSKGAHASPEAGMCAMEAAAFIAGEPHSDHPQCVCPVIAAFMRTWNDRVPDDIRQRLIGPLVLKVIGSRSTNNVQDRRAILVADWTQRVVLPLWMDLAELDAAQLRRLAEATTIQQLQEVSRVAIVNNARARCAAAGDAAWDAAWNAAGVAAGDAAWNAAWNAAGDAAGDAAWNAAWNAAGDAARAAAWNAAWNAAGDAARAAARDAAWNAAWAAVDAAWNAAWNAAGDAARAATRAAARDAVDAAWNAAGVAAGDAARAAARDVLSGTVLKIWASSVGLIERLIEEKE